MKWLRCSLVVTLLFIGCSITQWQSHLDYYHEQPWVVENGVAKNVETRVGMRYYELSHGLEKWLEWRLPKAGWRRSADVAAECRRFLDKRGELLVVDRTVPARMYIVSLDPAIVVIGPGSTRYLEATGGGVPSDDAEAGGRLPFGFRYGTRLPFEDPPHLLKWFSPGAESEIKPVTKTVSGGTIPTPWGALDLKRDQRSGYMIVSARTR